MAEQWKIQERNRFEQLYQDLTDEHGAAAVSQVLQLTFARATFAEAAHEFAKWAAAKDRDGRMLEVRDVRYLDASGSSPVHALIVTVTERLY